METAFTTLRISVCTRRFGETRRARDLKLACSSSSADSYARAYDDSRSMTLRCDCSVNRWCRTTGSLSSSTIAATDPGVTARFCAGATLIRFDCARARTGSPGRACVAIASDTNRTPRSEFRFMLPLVTENIDAPIFEVSNSHSLQPRPVESLRSVWNENEARELYPMRSILA